MDKKHFSKTNQIGFVFSAVLLAAFTQAIGSAQGQVVGVTVRAPEVVVVAPAPAPAPVVVVQDDYVYYPSYGVYFSSNRHQYAYFENSVWVWQPAPRGVTVDVLLASPHVHMDFHDSIENHHAEMMRRYPKDWKGSDEHQDAHHDDKERHDQPEHMKDAPDHDHDKK